MTISSFFSNILTALESGIETAASAVKSFFVDEVKPEVQVFLSAFLATFGKDQAGELATLAGSFETQLASGTPFGTVLQDLLAQAATQELAITEQDAKNALTAVQANIAAKLTATPSTDTTIPATDITAPAPAVVS